MKIKHIKNIVLAVLAVLAIACSEDPERADYVAFEGSSIELVTPATGSGSREVKVYTTAVSGSDRTFTIEVDPATTADPASFTVPATVTVPANSNVGTFVVQSDAANIGKNIVLKFGLNETTLSGSSTTLGIFEECLDNLLFLDIKFDNYPDEFAWQITDSEGNLMAGNEDFGEYPRNPAPAFRLAQIRERICLPAGNYTFTAYDAYGDGMFDGTNTGSFALRRVSDGVVIASDSGDFGSSSGADFTL